MSTRSISILKNRFTHQMNGASRVWAQRLGYLLGTLLLLLGVMPAATVNVAVAADTSSIADEVILYPTEPNVYSSYGAALDLEGEWLIVGAPYNFYNVTHSGSIYLYQHTSSNVEPWRLVQQISVNPPDVSDSFGAAVAVSRDIAVAVAKGKVYIFEQNRGGADNWGLVTILTEPNATNLLFGSAIALDQDRLVVGAREAAYFYERNAGGPDQWGLVTTIPEPTVDAFYFFGYDVAIQGDTVVIAESYSSPGGSGGIVHIYERNAGGENSWGMVATVGSAGAPSVDLSGDRLIAAGTSSVRASRPEGSAIIYQRNLGGDNAWGEAVKLSDIHIGQFWARHAAIGPDFALVGFENELFHGVNLYRPDATLAGAWTVPGPLNDQTLGLAAAIDGPIAAVGYGTEVHIYTVNLPTGTGTVDNCTTYGTIGQAGTLADALAASTAVQFACSGSIATPFMPLYGQKTIDSNGETVELHTTLAVQNGAIVELKRLSLIGEEDDLAIMNRGRLTLNQSTVVGGIYNQISLTIRNSTIAGKIQNDSQPQYYPYITASSDVENSTIVGELISVMDPAYPPANALRMKNTIVTNPTAGAACSGRLYSQGHNLATDASCGLNQPTDIVSGTANLGPLQDNGGPTWTYALLPGSDAIDAGDCSGGTITVDQRGVTRPQGAACDIGAFEAEAADEGAGYLYVSANTWGDVAGIRFADMDILVQDLATGTWAKFFDSKDVGLSGTDVDAFHVMHDGSILMSFSQRTHLSGVGWTESADIVRFVPQTLGNNTSGTFAPYLDGSTVGLSTAESNLERIDAIAMTPDGALVVSIKGAFTVPGIRGRDEDLIRFDAATGTFARYFDGSDVGLTALSEDIWGTFIGDDGALYLTTKGDYAVEGSSGTGADIFVCIPSSLGAETACTFTDYWQGGATGFGDEIVDGIGWSATLPAAYLPAEDLNAADFVMSETEMVADIDDNDPDETVVDDATNGADDTADGRGEVMEVSSKLFLPLIQK